MLKQLRVGAQVFQKYIGWNRVGMLLSLAIIVVAAVVLVHMLRDIKLDELARAVEATQLRHIAAAAAFFASPAARYVTGQVLAVDGGMAM